MKKTDFLKTAAKHLQQQATKDDSLPPNTFDNSAQTQLLPAKVKAIIFIVFVSLVALLILTFVILT